MTDFGRWGRPGLDRLADSGGERSCPTWTDCGAEPFFAEEIKLENESGDDLYRKLAREMLAPQPDDAL
jgi:hypothetical protein